MTRLLYLLIFSLFSFSAIAAENQWSYEYNNNRSSDRKHSAGLKVGYERYRVYPKKDGNGAVVEFGYWAGDLPPPTWFKITLKSSNGTLTFEDNITDNNMPRNALHILSGDMDITFGISKRNLEFHREATSLKIELSNYSMAFPMSNSRKAIDRAVAVMNNPTSSAASLEGLVDRCHKFAANRWDKNSENTGVEWKDIQANPAIEACSAAYSLDNSNLRIAYQLGRAYDKASNKRTLEFLKYAADNGYSPAAYHYSLLMDDGVYIAKNHTLYLQYLINAAQSGFTPAKSDYGEYLIKQTPPNLEDIQRGKVLLEAAVDDNYHPARYVLAMKWFKGTFGSRNNKLAYEYLTTASDLGHAKSSYYIAIMYRDGNLLEKNPAKYLAYLKKAASQGHKKAKEILAQ